MGRSAAVRVQVMTCVYPNCDCPVLFPEGYRPTSIATGCMRTVVCVYPDCNCAVSFPEGYRPSMATECPNPRDPNWRPPAKRRKQKPKPRQLWEPPSRDPHYQEARKIHALLLRCEGLNYREIGARLGVTGTRTPQMISSASRKLIGAMRRCRFRFEGGTDDQLPAQHQD
jgi:hypothetical protein